MSITDRDLCREAIRRTLRRRAGDFPDALAVAQATSEIWLLMSAQVAPVIGANGIEAIFQRSLLLTSVIFPWLASLDGPMNKDSFPARLAELMAGHESIVAAQAGSSLLTTFTELLATLIGNSLTRRLLDPVWEAEFVVAEQEKTSWTKK
ncbi:MAG: hypothetical protein RBR38_06450 [Desulfomicrobium apsheronum]|nr:hypothetical protein [Desulfomicrobium apsheronum]